MSQTTDILEYLRSGKNLTALDALTVFGCMRLAARINDIKKVLKENEKIIVSDIYNNGKTYANYRLELIEINQQLKLLK